MVAEESMADDNPFNVDEFSSQIGTNFVIRSESGDRSVELVEAGETRPGSGQYSLVFRDCEATAESYLPQSIYPFLHEQLGERQIFIVPIGPDSSGPGILYEAVYA